MADELRVGPAHRRTDRRGQSSALGSPHKLVVGHNVGNCALILDLRKRPRERRGTRQTLGPAERQRCVRGEFVPERAHRAVAGPFGVGVHHAGDGPISEYHVPFRVRAGVEGAGPDEHRERLDADVEVQPVSFDLTLRRQGPHRSLPHRGLGVWQDALHLRACRWLAAPAYVLCTPLRKV